MRSEGKTLPYEDMSQNPLRFLAGIEGKTNVTSGEKKRTEREQAEQALHFAVNYARKGCTYFPLTVYLSYTSGLAAYDRWINYMRNPSVTLNRYGMGQLAAVYAEAKKLAAHYLRGVTFDGESMRLVLLAAEDYEQAAGMLGAVSEKVPYMRNAEMLSQETLHFCVKHLETAKDFETAGIGYLEKALSLWERGKHE
jgi:hypothetical protein